MRGRRFGLRAQVLLLLGLLLLTVALLVGLLIHRQSLMHDEVAQFSRTALQRMIQERLRMRADRRIDLLRDALTNPVYYFDLEHIGELTGGVQREPDVVYVLVHDAAGRVLHDGSRDITRYGQLMDDPLAARAVSAPGKLMQMSADVLEVSAPILLGGKRLGGVRVGYSLASARRTEARSVAELNRKVGEVAGRNRVLLYLMVAAMLLLAAGSVLAIERRFLRPIRVMGRLARAIEAGRYDVDIRTSSRADEVGELQRALARMAASVNKHDREIRQIAFTDPLTGLPNRRDFHDRLGRRLQTQGEHQPLAVLFIDLDDFKRVNDTLGHEIGDRVLVQIADRIRGVVDTMDLRSTELSRFGGDEFVLMAELRQEDGHAARADTARLAQALLVELSRPVDVEGDKRVFLGSSIGIALFPEDAASASMLIRNSDVAMYQAKTAGKHCYRFYDRSLSEATERRIHLENDLREAWERGELTVSYQPIIDMEDKRIVGAEALLRWQHPEYDMVAPSVFISVAEQSGLIEKLGPRVLWQACTDAAAWREVSPEHADIFVSVNLSVRQLRDAWLPEKVASILADTGLSPSGLHLELTETAVLDDAIDSRDLMRRLREAGVKLWLDDFGTGFSGLNHLRRLPIDGVKIDRSFVADILHDADDRTLTKALIQMAHSLRIGIIAEGIEQQGQYELLREIGCERGQGFLLGRPMSQEAFLRQLR